MRVSPSCTFQMEGEPRQVQLADSGAIGVAVDMTGHGYILDIPASASRPLGTGVGAVSLAPGGNVLAVVRGQKLEAFDSRGSKVGALEFDSPLERCLVARSGGRMFAANNKGELFGFSPQGEFLWKIALSGRCDHLVDDPDGSAVFAVRDQRHISALDPVTGGKKWESSTLTSVTHVAAVRGGTLFIGTVDGRVAEYTASGSVAWNPRVGDRVAALGVSLDSKF
ncbi:MAG TPA: PQQ-binding-like beta-propeller repeat protein, partial [Thermoplasmata archaeon]|nr:PQQ-binding-like beta-propeller repeat protein [Thermoplasmata archaeon]